MKAVYTMTAPEAIAWPEPIETVVQAQQRRVGRGGGSPGARREDITLSMRLLIGSVVRMPQRPYGLITWLAEHYATTRQTIYDIGEWVEKQVEPAEEMEVLGGRAKLEPDRNKLSRSALTLMVPGAMPLRPTEDSLAEILGKTRSFGWLCELVDEAGQRAGALLAQADWTKSTNLIVARDELYFSDLAWFLTVDTQSLAILSGHVEQGADKESWGLSLALDAERTDHGILGLVEDAATYFPASVGVAKDLLNAGTGMAVQKDVWHLLRRAEQIVVDAERLAFKALEAAEKKAQRDPKLGWWVIRDHKGWQDAHAKADRAIERADNLGLAVKLLHQALAIVDPATEDILDRDTAAWYLELIIDHLRSLDWKPAGKLATSIQNQMPALLCFHDWLEIEAPSWRATCLTHLGDPDLVSYFERAVVRAWRLRRELTNGHSQRRGAARAAKAHVLALCQADKEGRLLADKLDAILEAVVRTSSAVECVNSLLRAFLWARRSFKNRSTAQNWLNLFVLWFNMHRFRRGRRAEKSPFEILGIEIATPDGSATDDWLDALGYPKAA